MYIDVGDGKRVTRVHVKGGRGFVPFLFHPFAFFNLLSSLFHPL